MAEITAALVKELRERSGAGMMDCKSALKETDGDIEAAIDWLRTKGLAKAAKKSGRVAAEGLVAAVTQGTRGALIEVNSETDFVARNEQFQTFVRLLADLALETDGDVEAFLGAQVPQAGKTVGESLTDLIATIGENMTIRRLDRLQVGQGAVVAYVHSAASPGLGKIGVIVALESAADPAALEDLGKQLAMHVAAAKPEAVDTANLDPTLIERERAVLIEQARDSGKPQEIIEKMVEGRLRKFYEEVVLLEQVFIMDGESKVGKVVEARAKELGQPIKVVDFRRFTLGEGVEKEEEDFAAEVHKALGG